MTPGLVPKALLYTFKKLILIELKHYTYHANVQDGFVVRSDGFAQHVCFQSVLCEQNLAPKQITHKAYDYVANYGYHLNATKFAQLLKDHCFLN